MLPSRLRQLAVNQCVVFGRLQCNFNQLRSLSSVATTIKEENGVLYGRLDRSLYQESIHLLHDVYHREETLRKALKVYDKDTPLHPCIEEFYMALLEEDLSVMALDKASGKMLGVSIVHEYKENDPKVNEYYEDAVKVLPRLGYMFAVYKDLYSKIPKHIWEELRKEKIMRVVF